MNYALIISILLGIAGTLGGYHKGVADARAKVQVTVSTEAIREAKVSGDLGTANAQHAAEQEKVHHAIQTGIDPTKCAEQAMPAWAITALGGVHDGPVRTRSP